MLKLKLLYKNFLSNLGIALKVKTNNVNTVPDQILKNARKSKLGYTKGVSFYDSQNNNCIKSNLQEKLIYIEANRDFKSVL